MNVTEAMGVYEEKNVGFLGKENKKNKTQYF